MKIIIQKILTDMLVDMGIPDVKPDVDISDTPEHGDYTTNVAMKLSKTLKKSPMQIGKELQNRLGKDGALKKAGVEKIEVMPPGFINIFISNEFLLENLKKPLLPNNEKKQTILVEYAQPNTHKAFHIGHLRNIITGESVVRLLETDGNHVIRANYQGDVGLHIAKALYTLLHIPNLKSQISILKTIQQKTDFLAQAYVSGNKAYEEDEDAKKEINAINKKIYEKNPDIYPLYEQTRAWSLEYFDLMYTRLGTHFDRLYFESDVYTLGKQLVTDGIKKGIFEESDGAVIFPGEKFGLHNRVFITSEGNPTYEGKDIGLAKLQFGDYHPDTVIHCVSTEQIQYFNVMFEAIARVFPDTRGKEYHLAYGFVQLKSGKMSSRTGNVVLGSWLLDEVKKAMEKIINEGKREYGDTDNEDIAEKATIAAIKYAFLKVNTDQEIAFDINESVNITGDSGPYLLYTYARCKSVIKKSKGNSQQSAGNSQTLNEEEHAVARLLLFFPDIVGSAATNYAPNILCEYLYDLAQAFNLFYAKHTIVGSDTRLTLTQAVADVMMTGLTLLGIPTVERM